MPFPFTFLSRYAILPSKGDEAVELTFINIALLILIGFGAAFVQRVSGFGLGIFAMLFLPYLLGDTVAAAAVSCLWSCVTSVYNAIKYRKNVDFRLLAPLICAAAVTIPVAVALSKFVPGGIMTMLLGIVLVLLSLYFLLLGEKIRIRPSLMGGILAGGLGGTLNGLFSTGGPPVVLYLAGATADKMAYFASIQCYFALTNIYSTGMRAISGILSWHILLLAAIGVLGSLLGDAVGKLIFNRLNAKRVKQVIYVGMIISGVLMIF